MTQQPIHPDVPCESMAQFLQTHMVTLDTCTLMGGTPAMLASLNRLPQLLANSPRHRLFLLSPVLDELRRLAGKPSCAALAAHALQVVERLAAAGMTIFDVPPLPNRTDRRFFDAALMGVCARYNSCARIGVITQDNGLAASLLFQNATLPSQHVISVRKLDPASGNLACFNLNRLNKAFRA